MEKSRKNKVKQKEDRIDSYRAATLEAVVPKLSPDRHDRDLARRLSFPHHNVSRISAI